MDAPKLDPQMEAALRRQDEIVAALGPPAPGVEGARPHARALAAHARAAGGPMVEQAQACIADVAGFLRQHLPPEDARAG